MMENNAAHLLQDGYLNSQQIELVRNQIRLLYKEIRTQAVPLVDAFHIPDVVLNSPLGRHDGDIYNKYMEKVKAAPGSSGPPPFFNSVVKPLIDGTSEIDFSPHDV